MANCLFCGRKLGVMSEKIEYEGGVLCRSCFDKHKVKMDFPVIAKFDDQNRKMFFFNSLAKRTDKEHFLVTFDSDYQLYKEDRYDCFSYDQIIDFELIEDGKSVRSGANALVGGLLLGATGAIIGASATNSTQINTGLTIRLAVKDSSNPSFYIYLLNNNVPKESSTYKYAFQAAQDIISKLQLIVHENAEIATASANAKPDITSTEDVVAKLRSFKALLDEGIIDKAEFTAMKRKFLGM